VKIEEEGEKRIGLKAILKIKSLKKIKF